MILIKINRKLVDIRPSICCMYKCKRLFTNFVSGKKVQNIATA